MIGVDGPPTTNELILSPRPGGRTMIEVRIEYPSKVEPLDQCRIGSNPAGA